MPLLLAALREPAELPLPRQRTDGRFKRLSTPPSPPLTPPAAEPEAATPGPLQQLLASLQGDSALPLLTPITAAAVGALHGVPQTQQQLLPPATALHTPAALRCRADWRSARCIAPAPHGAAPLAKPN